MDSKIEKEERLTMKEFAHALNLSYGTVRVYVYKGILKPIRQKGRRPYFTRRYLEEVLKNGF